MGAEFSLTREDRLYAVEKYGEGQQERELIDGSQQDSTGGKDESDLVVEAHDQHPEEESDRHRGRGWYNGCEPGTLSVARTELIGHADPARKLVNAPQIQHSTSLRTS